jgi:hypothetical protein
MTQGTRFASRPSESFPFPARLPPTDSFRCPFPSQPPAVTPRSLSHSHTHRLVHFSSPTASSHIVPETTSVIPQRSSSSAITPSLSQLNCLPTCQSDKISHIDIQDDHIDTVISHIISPYPISISRMTISILSSPISLAHIPYRYGE